MLQIKAERGGKGGKARAVKQAGWDRMLYKLYDFYLRASFELEPNKLAEGRRRRLCWLMEMGG